MKKLYRYVLLSLKNVPISVEDTYILCREVEHLVKVVTEKVSSSQKTALPMLIKHASGLGGLEQREDESVIKSPGKHRREKGLTYYLEELGKATKKTLHKINGYLSNYREATEVYSTSSPKASCSG